MSYKNQQSQLKAIRLEYAQFKSAGTPDNRCVLAPGDYVYIG